MSVRTTVSIFFAIFAQAASPSPAVAQPARDARLLVTVVDPSGAIIPGATVTLTALDTPLTPFSAMTTDKGLTTFSDLLPGRYDMKAEFSGFDPGALKNVRVRRGDNKHVIVVTLKKVEESVTVGRDAVAAAADPRGGSLVTQLTNEEINSLSDDPDEMLLQLLDMVGGSAVIKVDSFVGASLPPKALIRSIHIVRDTFPAENHEAENDEIEIVTQPGVGKIHGAATSRLRDGSMSGRNPFVDIKAPERTENVEGNFGGTIVPQKSSFALSVGRRHQFDTPVATFALPTGKQSVLLGERPTDNWHVLGLIDYAATPNQIVRVAYDQTTLTRSNLGVGGFDLAERAYSTDSQNYELRVQETGPIGRRLYANTRLQVRWFDSSSHSVLEAPTIRVLDGVTTGGAQVAGGRNQRMIELASDVDYVRGNHRMRAGFLLDGASYRSNDSTNYLGTYVFTSTDALAAGTPTRYSRRIGDPLITYGNLETGVYVQDDIKIRKNLTFSPGLRYEIQTHVSDYNGFAPRLGLTWAPAKSGKTTVRASYGVFYNWLGTSTYEQTLRVDGFRQRDLNIVNPSYPDVGSIGTLTAVDKYLLGPDVQLERYRRFGLAVDQTLSPKVRITLAYAAMRYDNQLRGFNLNAPISVGVRPNPAFANVIEAASDAETHWQQINPGITVNLAGGVRSADQPRWNPQRTLFRFDYRYRATFNNSDGAFVPPPSGTLATEWAPSRNDVRNRIRATVSSQALKNLNAQLNLEASSGAPYTITTGFDDNGDGIFNDRPFGVGRDTARLPWRSSLSANVSYFVGFRGGVAVQPGTGGERERSARGPRGITFAVSIVNLTNHDNYIGFSGVMTSKYFLQPTAVANPRQIDFTLRFAF